MGTLYLECISGISGDMTVAALLDLGASEHVLREGLKSLPLTGYEIQISRVKKAGIDACDFAVILEQENHDHDMEYLHGPEEHMHVQHEHGHGNHEHEVENAEEHAHGHDGHDHGHEHHEHRGLPEITRIITAAEHVNEGAKTLALRVFDILAEAEAKAHGTTKEKVHFHEVGAVDSIVDIVAAAICIEDLQVEKVIIPALYEGCGTIRCQHGILPIPVPAVAGIVQAHKLPLHITDVQGEFVTPTGAAIAAAIKTEEKLPDRFTVTGVGVGAGKRNYERPSLLRAMLIEESETFVSEDKIVKMETNIDDCSGEVLGYTMEQLFAAGARDVHYMPVFMKKNRPGYQLHVICTEDKMAALQQIIFKETTTIGIRVMRMDRAVLDREMQKISCVYGEVRVKVCTLPDGTKKCDPEYADVAACAKDSDVAFRTVYEEVVKTWKKRNDH